MQKPLSALLLALLIFATVITASAAALPADYNTVMSGISLSTPQSLNISKPAGNVSTTASSYYLTGSSDPNQPLSMNGYNITTRGAKGSFGVFVNLAVGDNLCTFTQGDVSRSVTITRNAIGDYSTTKTMSSMYPAGDMLLRSGDTVKITAIGPAGGRVFASVGGQTIAMRQNVAAAVEGVPATFSGELTAGGVTGLVSMGKITYTLSFNGVTSTHRSVGQLYVAAKGHPVVAQVVDAAVCLFEKDSTNSNYLTVLNFGMLDTIEESGGLYRLSMGGWVTKSAVEIRSDMNSVHNSISGVSQNRTGREEQFVFSGTSFPGYTVRETADTFFISFAGTSGLSSLNIQDSALFTGCTVSRGDDGYTTLAFARKAAAPIWGYVVEYEDGGITRLSFRTKPALSSGDRPLSGVSVYIDAGHGGADVGALGMPNSQNGTPKGPTEADINLANARALKNKLELLGARVIMARTTDTDSTMNARVRQAQSGRADFYISLHANAVSGNGTDKGGTEVYYYHDGSATLAKRLAENLALSTGRLNRGAKFSSYRVTLGSFAPGVLIETGFVTSPVEYDQLIDSYTIYKTATAIADSIIAELRG